LFVELLRDDPLREILSDDVTRSRLLAVVSDDGPEPGWFGAKELEKHDTADADRDCRSDCDVPFADRELDDRALVQTLRLVFTIARLVGGPSVVSAARFDTISIHVISRFCRSCDRKSCRGLANEATRSDNSSHR
jgi:hypothetical protein